MVLDDRLKKLAAGISAQKAARALARSMRPEQELTALEHSQAEEFKATLEAMFLMAAVDGQVSEEELSQLRASIHAIADMHTTDELNLDHVLNELNEALARDGWRARLATVAERLRTDDAKAFAFKLAAGVAFVDDEVAHAEAAAIEVFAGALGLSSDESQQILREVQQELFGAD
jgi:tellurite resistance protein